MKRNLELTTDVVMVSFVKDLQISQLNPPG